MGKIMSKLREYFSENQYASCEINAVNESSLSRVWSQTQEFDSGTISAYRDARECGEGKKYTKAEKQKRNGVLLSKLMTEGYGVTKIKGVYIENYKSDNEVPVKEESFMVVDIKNKGTLKKDLIRFGEMFEQDSVTYSKPSGEYYLISSNKCSKGYPGFGKVGVEEKLGKSMFGKKGEFYSRVNGRPFVFESIQNRLRILTDYPPTEIRSLKMLGDQME